MHPVSVHIKEVEKYFQNTFSKEPALKKMSVEILPGLFTGLVGPDGAGKTTLMRMIAGLSSPSSGSISVLGHDPVTESQSLRSKIGYMPQKFSLYEDLSVQQNLNLYANLKGLHIDSRKPTFQKLLEFTNLAPFTRRLAGALSGGMKQKLALACALMTQPELLLLDEPSVGVDPIGRRELWKMVTELVSQGMGVIWSTSYLDEAEKCQQVLLLNKGTLLFHGQPHVLTQEVEGCTFHVTKVQENKRKLLGCYLNHPDIMDGVIQGENIRIMTRDKVMPPAPTIFGVKGCIVPIKPWIEDAFINRLGGGPGGISMLSERFKNREISDKIIIECKGLTKKFGDFTATNSVDFSIKQGEIFGFLGPNGAGKSTTFKMLCGLLKPTQGEAMVNDIHLSKSPSKARAQLGYMAQKFSLYGNLSVLQNLEFFSGIYGLKRKVQKDAIANMITVFELQPYLRLQADTLPLGFKQRLALACSVMHQPSVLFLDEPTSGVDPISRREFWNHINGLVQKGVTVMVTTHFMDEAEYCDRIAIIYQGRKIGEGHPDALKAIAKSKKNPNPTMEDAFIAIIEQSCSEKPLEKTQASQ